MSEPNLDIFTVSVKVDRAQLGDDEYVDGIVTAIADQARRRLRDRGGDVDTIEQAVSEAAASPGRVVTVRP